jgi:hypothetical protein
MSAEGVRALTQVYAAEGGAFTLMATQLVSEAGAEAVGLDYRPNGPTPYSFFLPPGGGW